MRGELDRLAVEGDARGLGVEAQRAALDVALGVAGGAAHLGADAGQQLLHVEGLGDVVVGAGVHAGDLVAPAVARGEDDDRHVALGAAPLLEHADAVHLGQADVEDDDVVGLGLAEEVAFLAVEGGIDGVAGVGQRRDELAIEIAIILDDQNAQVPSLRWRGPTAIGVAPTASNYTGRRRPARLASAGQRRDSDHMFMVIWRRSSGRVARTRP